VAGLKALEEDTIMPLTGKRKKAYDKEWMKTHYYKPEGRAGRLVSTAKCRAKKKGREFSLTTEWALKRLQAGTCEVSGLPFDLGSPTGLGKSAGPMPMAPSIDRIDQSKGYTTENSRMILNCLNAFKNVMTDAQMFDIMRITLANQK
jgi:hypothetical protein